MARRELHPLDILLQLTDPATRRGADQAMRAVRFQPSVDVYETRTDLVVKIELPGIRSDRVNITLSADDRTLTVSGVREDLHGESCLRVYQLETYFGEFEREILLPATARFDRDHITANYRDGFLVIALPRREPPQAEKRIIEITNQ